MFTIEGVERLLGTDALASSGWLLLRAVQSREGAHVCALVELVPSKRSMKSALGMLAPIFASRLSTDSDAGMVRGTSSFLFASEEREVGVIARRDRITFVLVAPASSPSVQGDLAACEVVDGLLAEATKIMDKIALASAIPIDLSKLPASWLSTRGKPKQRLDPDDYDDEDSESDSDSLDERPLPPMTRKEWHQQLEGIARAIGESPVAFREGIEAQILARKSTAFVRKKR